MKIRGPRPPKLMTVEERQDCYERVREAVRFFQEAGEPLPHLQDVANRAGLGDLDTVRWLLVQVMADQARKEQR